MTVTNFAVTSTTSKSKLVLEDREVQLLQSLRKPRNATIVALNGCGRQFPRHNVKWTKQGFRLPKQKILAERQEATAKSLERAARNKVREVHIGNILDISEQIRPYYLELDGTDIFGADACRAILQLRDGTCSVLQLVGSLRGQSDVLGELAKCLRIRRTWNRHDCLRYESSRLIPLIVCTLLGPKFEVVYTQYAGVNGTPMFHLMAYPKSLIKRNK